VKDIVPGKGLRRGTGKRALAGLAVLAVVGIAGVVAGWGVSPVEPTNISAADVVALRFPTEWVDDDATASTPSEAPAAYALASATEPRQVETSLLFSPYQTFPMPPAQPDVAAVPAMQQTAAPEKASEAKNESKPVVATVRAVAPAPERRAAPAPRPRKDSGTLFNDAQLASIKARLKLSDYQEQYWPPVESALRAIGWRASHDGARKSNPHASPTRLAEIDPDSSEVQQLKSAAFPLIMSMNDEQKQQVRMLAHVMGLERVAASF
jgi:hypothetical protein